MKNINLISLVKKIFLIILCVNPLLIKQESVLSHGNKENCMSECKSYYCPSESKENFDKIRNDTSIKDKNFKNRNF
tara:strand:+ start:16720 stop:16947 length:228 start_codon:yes stop_codon:yes gene_type:complete